MNLILQILLTVPVAIALMLFGYPRMKRPGQQVDRLYPGNPRRSELLGWVRVQGHLAFWFGGVCLLVCALSLLLLLH